MHTLNPFRTGLCLLVVGLVLLLSPPAQARDIVHVVQKGQNLGMIAKRYHTSARAIERHNRLKPGKRIYPGQKLRIYEVAEHRRWRRFMEEKAKPKKAKPKKAKPKKAKPKKAKPKKAKPKKSKPKKSTQKAPRRNATTLKTARKPRRATSKTALRRTKKRHSSGKKNRTREKPLYAKYKRKPRRRGRVTMVRHSERFRGTLLNKKGQLVARSARRVDRLLRSLRTGKKTTMNRRLLKLLARTSAYFGHRAVILVSGYRPYAKKQYTRNSRHNHGNAVDFRIVGVPNRALFEYCRTLRNVGCGYYPNSVFVHMDVRKRKTQWTDYSRPGQKPVYAHRLKKRQRKRGTPKSTRRKRR